MKIIACPLSIWLTFAHWQGATTYWAWLSHRIRCFDSDMNGWIYWQLIHLHWNELDMNQLKSDFFKKIFCRITRIQPICSTSEQILSFFSSFNWKLLKNQQMQFFGALKMFENTTFEYFFLFTKTIFTPFVNSNGSIHWSYSQQWNGTMKRPTV